MTETGLTRGNRLIPLLLGALLLWVVLIVTCAQWTMSPTFDEQNHVARGIAILRTGDFRLCFHHPPLANILEGLPVAWGQSGFSTQMPAWQPGTKQFLSIWDASHVTIWSDPAAGLEIIRRARYPVLLFTLVLGVVVFLWSRELFGPWGGLLSVTLFALDPTILAHSGLATTDMAAACTIVLAVYLLRRYLLQPTRQRFVFAGVGIGLALAAKFSALILLPMVALTLLAFALHPPRLHGALFSASARPWASRVARAVGLGCAMLVIAGFVLWGIYGFHVESLGSKPGIPVAAHASLKERLPVPALQYFRGLKAVKKEADGHLAYLNGETDTTGKGWWYYFPVAVAVKTPLPELCLLLGILIVLAVPRARAQLAIPRRELLCLLLPVAIYTLAALGLFGISLNLGIRHILPIYPFLFILAGGWVMLRLPARYSRPALGLALAAQCAGVLMAYPNLIAYFNAPAEARSEGYRTLIDSNYDWGQDLGRLAALQRRDHLYPLAFSYFGTTPPEAYGITCTSIAGKGLMSRASKLDLTHFHGFLAISVTDLMGGIGYTGVDYSFLQQHRPYARAGKTIILYRLP
ncbi:MAG TPA: glycosyltransferase family 39 protein [Armatimonadota bacterium]